MTDFYNYSDFGDYPITPEMGIDEIHDKLADLRRIWNQREIHNPQKARIVLTVLDQADQAFENEESKQAYDRQLAQQNQRGNNENPPGYSSDSDFIDFYNAGLGISRAMSWRQIVATLNELKRSIQNEGLLDSEQYSKLNLIEQGLVVFQDGSSKSRYDAELDRRNTKPPVNDAEQERRKKLDQLRIKAVNFKLEELYDEAYQVAQEALSYYKPEEDDFLLYQLLGDLCYLKKQGNLALPYYKKCVTVDQDNPRHYAMIALLHLNGSAADSAECRKYAEKAIEKAQACKNDEYVANGYGVLAASYWTQPPQDQERAVKYAKQYAETDTWDNAKQVLGFYEKKCEAEKAKREKRIKEAKRQETIQKAEEERIEEERKRQEEILNRQRTLKTIKIVLIITLIVIAWVSCVSGSCESCTSRLLYG